MKFVCPFCGETYTTHNGLYQVVDNGAVASYQACVIECPCGATYAALRGRRPERETDEGD